MWEKAKNHSKSAPRPHEKGTTSLGFAPNMRTQREFERQRAMAMSAANLTTLETELEIVEQWRHEELERAGYDSESATVLAASHEVDLHYAIELLERGCPANLALQILL
jgi:hypothetical protein